MQNSTTPDHVNHPSHYGGDSTYEAVNVIEAWNLGWHLGSAVKYIARAGKKPNNPELQDLKKARWYIDRRIAQLEGNKEAETCEFVKSCQNSITASLREQMPVASPEKQLLTWEQADEALRSKKGSRISHLEWSCTQYVTDPKSMSLLSFMSPSFYII